MESTSNHLLQNCDLPPPSRFFFPPQTSKVNNGESLLIRALQLSEKRAEEAERRILLSAEDKQKMASLLLEESMRVSAYSHLVRLHETEIAFLQKRLRLIKEEEEKDHDNSIITGEFYWTITICLGLFGLGFILGRQLG